MHIGLLILNLTKSHGRILSSLSYPGLSVKGWLALTAPIHNTNTLVSSLWYKLSGEGCIPEGTELISL
jgi:hypothetical protein